MWHCSLSYQYSLFFFFFILPKKSSHLQWLKCRRFISSLLWPVILPFVFQFCLLLVCLSPGQVLDPHQVSLKYLINLPITTEYSFIFSDLCSLFKSCLFVCFKNGYNLPTFNTQSISNKIQFLDNRRLSTLCQLFPQCLEEWFYIWICFKPPTWMLLLVCSLPIWLK